jgi:lysozyme
MSDFLTTVPMRQMIENWEGDQLTAYRDPVGVLTIGYGHTGSDVIPGLTITEDQADVLLTNDLHKFELAVNALCGSAPTTQNQFDALVSFAFNLGAAALKTSTLLALHLAGNYPDAADEFLKWDHAGGEVLPGLLARRQGEAAVYLTGTYS